MGRQDLPVPSSRVDAGRALGPLISRWGARLTTALVAAVALPAPAQPQLSPDEAHLPVPFVSQGTGPNLRCGGATVAMIRRAFGDGDAAASDLDRFVDPSLGGITTDDLVSAVESLGLETQLLPSRTEALEAALVEDKAVAALIEVGPDRYHYVVVVGVGPQSVIYHDPVLGPSRREPVQSFTNRWAGARHWAVAVEPGAGWLYPRAPSASEAEPTRPLDPELEGAALDSYLAGHESEALGTFQRAGGLTVASVEIFGARRTPNETLTSLTATRPGDRLDPSTYRRAARRLGLLPAALASRLEYIPQPGGAAALRGWVVEGPSSPDRWAVAAQSLRGLAQREIELYWNGVLGRGEQIRAGGTFDPGREKIHIALAAPTLRESFPGILRIEARWARESYRDAVGPRTGSPDMSSVKEARAQSFVLAGTDVVAGGLALTVRTGGDRWDGGALRPRLGLSAAMELGSRWSGSIGGDVWPGWGGAEGVASVEATVALAPPTGSPPLGGGWDVAAEAGFGWVSDSAPLPLWKGAGTGRLRSQRLRAHPLWQNGAIRVRSAAFGRALLNSSLELATPALAAKGPLQIRGAIFVDYAASWQGVVGPASNPSTFQGLDGGVGIRLGTDTRSGLTLGVDMAWGLLDRASALSVHLGRS